MKMNLNYILFIIIAALSACTNPFGGNSVFNFTQVDLDWSSKNYDFGDQQIGSSTTKIFYISNSGNLDATDCGSVNLSDTTNFSISSQTCTGTTLPSGSQCGVTVESHPVTAGEKNLTIDRQCRVKSNIVSLVNQVRVTAVLPTAQWTPMVHDFGTIKTQALTFTKKFTLTNSGTGSINNCGLATLSNPTDFTILADTCGVNNLAANSSCDVTVVGRPQTPGIKKTTLSRTCDTSLVFSTGMDQLTAEGFESFFGLYPSSVDLGTIIQGNTTSSYAYYQNESVIEPVSCEMATLSDSTYFSIFHDDCGTRGLTLGDYCAVQISTSAGAPVGEHQTYLMKSCTFADSSVKSISIPVSVKVQAPTPNLVTFSSSNNFGNVDVGGAGTDNQFYFYNGGSLAASGCGVPTLSNTTDFSILTNNCNGSDIPSSGGYCDLTVRALPQSPGAKTANLSMTCAVGGTVTVAITQNALAPAPALVVNTTNANYGSIAVGSSGSYTLTFSNNGPLPGTGCSAPVLSNTTEFSISADACSTNDLAGSASCAVTVVASPQSSGAKTGTLTRSCSVGGNLVVNLNVTGFVPAPNLYWTTATHDFGDVDLGTYSSASTVYLYNSGQVNATGCSAPTLSNSTDFAIGDQSCFTNDINAYYGSYCYVQVHARPMSAGIKTTTLSRTCSVGGTVSTTTNGFTTNGKMIADWQKEYDDIYSFGALSLGKTSNTLKYFFRNPNEDVLTGCTQASISNTNDFEIVSNTCTAGTMAEGSSCTLEVRAIGVTIGAKTTQINRSCSETGNKTLTLNSTPATAATAVHIASGGNGTCAVMSDGTVRCWGSGRFFSSIHPQVISGVTNAIKISVADYQACALLSTGQVNCWGWDSYGVLGSSSGGIVHGLSHVIDVVAGKESTCSVVNDGVTEIGVVKCWGGGNPYSPQPVTVIPYTSTGLPVVGAIQVAAGGYDGREFCALLNTKELACGDFYGTGSYTMAKKAGVTDAEEITMLPGRLSYRSSAGQVKTYQYGAPMIVPGSSNVLRLAANNTPYAGESCALFDNGTTERGVVKCWSYDQYTGNPTAAVTVAGIDHLSHLAVSSYGLICGIKDTTGIVFCKSDSAYQGQIGDLTTNDKKVIEKFELGGAVENASTGFMSCAVMQTGQVKCWGSANDGAGAGLGDGIHHTSATPVIVSGISNAIEVKTGNNYACAVLATGAVKCWGWNWFGKLGNGNSTSSNIPVDVVNVSNVTMISMGDQLACALEDDGATINGVVKCWGANSGGGVLGGSSSSISTPVDMGITGAVKIASDTQTTCAVMNTGGVKCWGANVAGQLGIGSTTPNVTYTPSDVLDITNAVDVVAGEWHFCARLTDQTVSCWGYNNSSQIGSTPDNMRPFVIPGLTGVVDLSATSSRSCALLNTGKMKCFGASIGDLTFNSSARPQTVMNVSNIKKLTHGYMGSLCFINTSDELMCMGRDTGSNGLFKAVTGF